MKDDLKLFNDVCNKHKMTEEEKYEFSDFIHRLKRSGDKGSGKKGDFTFGELDELAKEFKGETDE